MLPRAVRVLIYALREIERFWVRDDIPKTGSFGLARDRSARMKGLGIWLRYCVMCCVMNGHDFVLLSSGSVGRAVFVAYKNQWPAGAS